MKDLLLMVLMLGILGVLTLCSLQKDDNKQMLSLPYTTAIKGLACIIVILVHIPANFSNPIQDIVGSFGFVGVTAFFMISAYGLRVSFERNKNYLAQFWKKRIPALLIPALLINVLAFFLQIVLFKTTAFHALLNINSYIYAILVAYLVFWVIYKFNWIPTNYKDPMICVIILFLSLLTYFTKIQPFFLWPTESIGFIWGLLLFRLKDKFQGVVSKKYWVSVIVLGLLSAVVGLSYLKFKSIYFIGAYLLKILLGAVVLAFAMALMAGRSFRENSILVKLGSISYEVYLGHLIVIDYAQNFLKNTGSGVFIWLVILVTIVIAWIANRVSFVLIKIINKSIL